MILSWHNISAVAWKEQIQVKAYFPSVRIRILWVCLVFSVIVCGSQQAAARSYYSGGLRFDLTENRTAATILFRDTKAAFSHLDSLSQHLGKGHRVWVDETRGNVLIRAEAMLSLSSLQKILSEQEIDAEVAWALSEPRGGGGLYLDTGEILVRFPNEMSAETVRERLRKEGFSPIEKFSLPGNVWLAGSETGKAYHSFSTAERLILSGEVLWAQPNFYQEREKRNIPNDPFFPNQWYLRNTGQGGGLPGVDMKMTQTWYVTTGIESVIIAVVDDAVEVTHPDLAGQIVSPTDVIRKTGTFQLTPWDIHGTACAGIAAARGNNSEGIAGVAYGCRIMPIRLLTENMIETPADEAAAFLWALEKGAAVILNAWGPIIGYSYVPMPDVVRESVDLFVEEARGGLGGVVCFAAGNFSESIHLDGYAGYYNTVAVTSSTDNGLFASYSNFGGSVEVNAPAQGGGGVWTTDRTGFQGFNPGYAYEPTGNYTRDFSGTSAAVSMVAGLYGLVFSIQDLTGYQARFIVADTADNIDPLNEQFPYGTNGHSRAFGYGRINAFSSIGRVFFYNPEENPPEAVTDLSWTTGDRLRWTAPSDAKGQKLFLYDLRVSNLPITEENFRYAAPINDVIRPGLPGYQEDFFVSRISYPSPDNTWHFALACIDGDGNRGPLSNVVRIGPPLTPTPTNTPVESTATHTPSQTATPTPTENTSAPTATTTPSPAPDQDGDGIPDHLEGGRFPEPDRSSRYLPDSDGDGLLDGEEDLNLNGLWDAGETRTRYRDSDGNGFIDGIEVKFLVSDPINPLSPHYTYVDRDGDELPDFMDYSGTNPDFDGDRFLDGYEVVKASFDPLDPASSIRASADPWRVPPLGDLNADSVRDNGDAQMLLMFCAYQQVAGTNPAYADLNRDGVIDNADAQILLNYFGRTLIHLPAPNLVTSPPPD